MLQLEKTSIEESVIDVPRSDYVNALTDNEKIRKIEYHFAKIMDTLGLDLEDDSLKDTPRRVAKMYVKEIFSGLNSENEPSISLFENKYNYNKMLVEKNITLYSNCEHHFVPIIGKVHIAYIPRQEVIGLSKLNRLVDFYARRPQVQERLTIQIADALKKILKHDDVAVVIEADHMCVASRGIKDTNSSTISAIYSGKFEDEQTQRAFLSYIK
ncbi:MAG: GTP cyclohydrolase I FolE [Saprospiraceae bacterium]|nr:GTP cyclohydrolase I FolE [Saprospiraceae bacterium]MCZ2337048.1 GTP cyclohydrolase I FolE [Chitinophagales bacterium]